MRQAKGARTSWAISFGHGGEIAQEESYRRMGLMAGLSSVLHAIDWRGVRCVVQHGCVQTEDCKGLWRVAWPSIGCVASARASKHHFKVQKSSAVVCRLPCQAGRMSKM